MNRGRRSPNLLRDIAELPWLVGVFMAGLAWVALRYVLPVLFLWSGNQLAVGLAPVARSAAPLFAGLCLAAAAVSWWRASDRRRLLDSRTDLDSIRSLSWERFEHLVGEAFRRRGYVVRENRSKGADRGIDLVLERNAETVLVQCKRWDKPVGVPVVRELLGAVTAEGATRGVLAAAGRFTEPARAFAQANGIELVDGRALERLVREGQSVASSPPAVVESSTLGWPGQDTDPIRSPVDPAAGEPSSCPRCQAPMTRRTARRGSRSGTDFLGCTRFPACRGTRSID